MQFWIKNKKKGIGINVYVSLILFHILKNCFVFLFVIWPQHPQHNTNYEYCKYIPPFPFRKNNRLLFPSGKFVTYCTLAELRACNDDSFYKVLESYQYFDDSPPYPYKEFVESIYRKRMKFKNEDNPLQLPLKVILNYIK